MSIRDIKRRMKSIKNIKQITKAMGLVSATKLQKMRTEFESSRPFFLELEKMAQSIPSKIYSDEKQKHCIILISSTRGLCASYNINVSKFAMDLFHKHNDSSLLVIGRCGCEIINRNKIYIDKFFPGNENNSFSFAKTVADTAISYYKNGYEIYLVYTQFYSAMKFVPAYKKILPLAKINSDFIFEPDADYVMEHFVKNYVSSIILSAMMESSVCEQSSRMMSMNSASDNADQIISELTLKYNRLRQNQITQELTEIISGADALKN